MGWKWKFDSGSYIRVYNGIKDAWFKADGLEIRVAWTEGDFTPTDWNDTLACVKEAKKILKRIRRI